MCKVTFTVMKRAVYVEPVCLNANFAPCEPQLNQNSPGMYVQALTRRGTVHMTMTLAHIGSFVVKPMATESRRHSMPFAN